MGTWREFSEKEHEKGVLCACINLCNGDRIDGATDLTFFNALPANVTIATPANATSDCGTHTLSAPEGGSLVTFAGGSIDPDPSGGFLSVQCTVSLDVTGSTLGLYFNITGDLTSSAGNSGTASDDLNVVATLPGFTKAFSPSTIQQFATSTLTYTIDNSANAARIGNLDFTDTLPTGLVIAPTPLASTTCGVIGVPSLPTVVTAAPGGNQISLDANGTNFLLVLNRLLLVPHVR